LGSGRGKAGAFCGVGDEGTSIGDDVLLLGRSQPVKRAT